MKINTIFHIEIRIIIGLQFLNCFNIKSMIKTIFLIIVFQMEKRLIISYKYILTDI